MNEINENEKEEEKEIKEKTTREEKSKELSDEIQKEERQKRNKKILKITFIVFITTFIVFSISYIILRYVGTSGLVVREYAIYNDYLPEDFNGIKIIHFSDIHYSNHSSIDNIKTLVETINKANPDIVIFTGDLINDGYSIDTETKENIMKEFNNIKAKIGKYAIKGDEDKEEFKEIFDNSNFKILDNTIEKIYVNSSVIDLIALNDDYTKETVPKNDDNYSITIVHKPDLAKTIITDYNTPLIMAGHSLNGQIVLPLIGPVMKKEGARIYPSSYYRINNTDLYVSGGIGNSRYQFRLLNHPSINFYRLRTNK
jgi:predicted MPP superfamily phosphohydrolase